MRGGGGADHRRTAGDGQQRLRRRERASDVNGYGTAWAERIRPGCHRVPEPLPAHLPCWAWAAWAAAQPARQKPGSANAAEPSGSRCAARRAGIDLILRVARGRADRLPLATNRLRATAIRRRAGDRRAGGAVLPRGGRAVSVALSGASDTPLRALEHQTSEVSETSEVYRHVAERQGCSAQENGSPQRESRSVASERRSLSRGAGRSLAPGRAGA